MVDQTVAQKVAQKVQR
jgi:hypothetical protein